MRLCKLAIRTYNSFCIKKFPGYLYRVLINRLLPFGNCAVTPCCTKPSVAGFKKQRIRAIFWIHTYSLHKDEKKEPTLIQTACTNVAGFSELYEKFRKKITVSGRGQSTLKNYSHHLAKVALHFNCLPTELDCDQLNDYLYLVKREHNTPSNSYFKFTVYSLRYVFRMEGLKDKRIELPVLRGSKKLPVVLSKPEVKRLLSAPKLLKHRVLIATLYDCGLRCAEVRNLRLSDLDFDRRMLHVRQGKGGKDRYVPLSEHLIRGL